MWDRMAERADLIVAHNLPFDLFLMQTAWARGKSTRTFDQAHGRREQFCTMKSAAPVVKMPPTERMLAAGFTHAKPPKLEECIHHFFGEKLEGAHDALIDVRACARVFFHLRQIDARTSEANAA